MFVDLLPPQQRQGHDHWYSDTTDAVFQSLDIIRRYREKYLVVLVGDHIYKMDYSRMLLEHVLSPSCTVACIEAP
ncbi:hypothetical protein JBO46_06165 [Serratia fonticola]|nr:hypothetical protein [Serratia fonticola]